MLTLVKPVQSLKCTVTVCDIVCREECYEECNYNYVMNNTVQYVFAYPTEC